MKKVLMAVVFLVAANIASSQKLGLPDLYNILDLSQDKIDTLMKQKRYRLLQKEIDSTSSEYYYNNLEHNAEGPDWVRSVTVAEVSVKDVRSRLVTYRTYRKKEYEELMGWLLRSGFRTTNREEFKDGTLHSNYSDGQKNVLVKVVRQKMPSGVFVLSYEFEIGK